MTGREPGRNQHQGNQEGRDPAPRQGRKKTREMGIDHLEGLTARWAEAASPENGRP